MAYALELLTSKIKREAELVATMLSRQELASLTSIPETFSMYILLDELETKAPMMMALFCEVVLTGRKKALQEVNCCLSHGQVLATICCMMAFTRNEKSSNFQVVLGLFLLGSGAKKGLIEVLAHVGLTVSYSTIVNQVKQLSKEGMEHFVRTVHETADASIPMPGQSQLCEWILKWKCVLACSFMSSMSGDTMSIIF
ncbi:hypothetical protein JB92DRAFT_2721832 [Gautieria morchelliformis]|nr:hypothetical protein JB92DRAFT_2721832 [Gautieria morchelliformis]